MKKFLPMFIAVCLTAAAVLGGCANRQSESPSASGSGDTGERVKLTMFMGDAGIKVPNDVDPGDNHIINIIEDLANVDLVITKPEYMDFQTRFNLMMSSGEVLDIVHAWFPTDVRNYGRDGAFAALDDIIKNSPILSKWQKPEQLDLVRADDGKLYGLFANQDPSGDIGGHVVRYDLIDEFMGGVIPTTPDGYYELAMKVKEAYPESTPFSTQGNLSFLTHFFMSYEVSMGANGASVQINKDGKAAFSFDMPGMREAVIFYNKLYADNLIDPNFITNKYEDFVLNRIPEHNVVSIQGGHWAIQIVLEEYIKKGNLAEQMLMYAPLPVAPGYDKIEVNKRWPKPAVGFHSISIASSCPDLEAGVRVVEAFVDPETKFISGYGTEGLEFKYDAAGNVDIDLEISTENNWRQIYSFMWQYWYDETIAVKNAGILAAAPKAYADEFKKLWNDTVKYNIERAEMAGQNPLEGILLPSDINARQGDMELDSLQIVLKAITGQITMAEYDTQVAAFLTQYAFYKQAVQDWYDAK